MYATRARDTDVLELSVKKKSQYLLAEVNSSHCTHGSYYNSSRSNIIHYSPFLWRRSQTLWFRCCINGVATKHISKLSTDFGRLVEMILLAPRVSPTLSWSTAHQPGSPQRPVEALMNSSRLDARILPLVSSEQMTKVWAAIRA